MEDKAVEQVRINITKVIDKSIKELEAKALEIRNKDCGTVGNAEVELAKLQEIDRAIDKLRSEGARIVEVVKNGGSYKCPYCCPRSFY